MPASMAMPRAGQLGNDLIADFPFSELPAVTTPARDEALEAANVFPQLMRSSDGRQILGRNATT